MDSRNQKGLCRTTNVFNIACLTLWGWEVFSVSKSSKFRHSAHSYLVTKHELVGVLIFTIFTILSTSLHIQSQWRGHCKFGLLCILADYADTGVFSFCYCQAFVHLLIRSRYIKALDSWSIRKTIIACVVCCCVHLEAFTQKPQNETLP